MVLQTCKMTIFLKVCKNHVSAHRCPLPPLRPQQILALGSSHSSLGKIWLRTCCYKLIVHLCRDRWGLFECAFLPQMPLIIRRYMSLNVFKLGGKYLGFQMFSNWAVKRGWGVK